MQATIIGKCLTLDYLDADYRLMLKTPDKEIIAIDVTKDTYYRFQLCDVVEIDENMKIVIA